MSALRRMTLRLDAEGYERLEAEAMRLGVPPATLVRMYVRSRLTDGETETERLRRTGLDALDKLANLAVDLPPVDAAQIARESR